MKPYKLSLSLKRLYRETKVSQDRKKDLKTLKSSIMLQA